jgi:hypothetical protein
MRISLFFLVLGFELRALHLQGRCLSHASSPVCSGYFGDKFLLFAQTGLDCNPPILCFLASLG